jgi:protein-S-isoprenylcysteine O-methyltransferase Ste14
VSAPSTAQPLPTTAARIGFLLFRNRSFLPIPFLLVPLFLGGGFVWWQWAAGLALVVIGAWWRLAGVSCAGAGTRRRDQSQNPVLVTWGPFAWSRNPLYNGNFFLWMGFTVLAGPLWFVPVAAVVFAIEYSLIVRYEEAGLRQVFGEEYRAYVARTPRWVPRLPQEASHRHGPRDWAEAVRSERSTFIQYAALLVVFGLKQAYLAGLFGGL